MHGVVGSSRTFMGEESAGIDAVRIAQARIAAGQSELTLVGGAYNATRWDVLLIFEQSGSTLREHFAPVWDRGPQGGIALGNMGAFLVLESREHAQARGARAQRSPLGGPLRPQSPPARRNRSDAAQGMGGHRRQGRPRRMRA